MKTWLVPEICELKIAATRFDFDDLDDWGDWDDLDIDLPGMDDIFENSHGQHSGKKPHNTDMLS